MAWSKWMLYNCNYKTISTFWDDFSIAEQFGVDAIQDTYNRAFKEWKSDYKMLTELVMVLNHKIAYYYGQIDVYAKIYNSLWEKTDAYAMDHLKDEALRYFLETTD